MSIAVLGALHLDVIVAAPRLPHLDETLTGHAVRYAFGGKGGNQAVAAARMGARAVMIGAVGTDDFAETLLAGLDAGGVDRGAVICVAGASGMSVAIVDADGGYGAVIVSAANLTMTGNERLPADITHLLLQNEIPAKANLAAARAARAAGAMVILNAAPARTMPTELLALIDLLIVNRVEAAMMCDGADNDAWALRDLGPHAAIVTRGAEGLIGAGADGVTFVQLAHSVDVISTHGAGDAFIGGLAARLAAGDGLQVACAFAQGAAALHVATPIDERAAITPVNVRAFLTAQSR